MNLNLFKMEPITETNFFSLILPYLVKGMDLTLTMRCDDGKITVGVRPNHTGVKDETFKKIPSLVLTHPVDDLNKSFFTTIAAPLDNTQALAEALQAWEAKFNAVKGEAEKKMEKQPEADKPKPAASKPKKRLVPAAKKKAAAAPKAKGPSKEVKAAQVQALKDKYAAVKAEALRLSDAMQHELAIKEAQKLLRMPVTAGSLKESQDTVKHVKDAHLADRCQLLRMDYDKIGAEADGRDKMVSEIKKKLKGLMGVDSKHSGVISLNQYIADTEAGLVKAKIAEQTRKLIDNAHALIKGQNFADALKILKDVKKLEPGNEALEEILLDLEGKLGKDFIANTFK